jgi:hypothetical protein
MWQIKTMENLAGAELGTGYGHHILARKFRHLDLLVKEAAAVAQLVEALHYKPEGRRFDS